VVVEQSMKCGQRVVIPLGIFTEELFVVNNGFKDLHGFRFCIAI